MNESLDLNYDHVNLPQNEPLIIKTDIPGFFMKLMFQGGPNLQVFATIQDDGSLIKFWGEYHVYTTALDVVDFNGPSGSRPYKDTMLEIVKRVLSQQKGLITWTQQEAVTFATYRQGIAKARITHIEAHLAAAEAELDRCNKDLEKALQDQQIANVPF